MPAKKTKADKSTINATAQMLSEMQPRTKLDRKAFIKEIVRTYGTLAADDCGDCADCVDCSSADSLEQLIKTP